MSSLTGRMDRIMATMTAQERAAAAVRRWKDGKKPDRALTATMPESQAYKYAELMGMAGVANSEFVLMLFAMEERVNTLEQMAMTLTAYEAMRHTLAFCEQGFLYGSEEMVTVSEYAERKRRTRRKVPAPKWGRAIRVVPDAEAASAFLSAHARERARFALDAASEFLGGLHGERSEDSVPAKLAAHFVQTIRQSWSNLRAFELALEELEDGLLGEDPLAEAHREMLDDCRTRIEKLMASMAEVVGEVELVEPEKADVKLAREFLQSG